MKQEEELLKKDLCARLLYMPMVEYKGETYNILGITHGRLVLCKPFMSYTLDECPLVEEVKPYLFPISSMTEEQLFEVSQILGKNEIEIGDGYLNIIDSERHVITYLEFLALLEWFNKNHFDYRELIPRGLANDATGLNIY